MTNTAFVPARSGSKRLPNKNIRMLGRKPLAVWTIEACVNAPEIDEVIFSTDSEQYWDTVRQYVSSDKLVLDDRSMEEAGDKIKIFDYLKNHVEKVFGNRTGKFMLALPTMPLRNAAHISEAFEIADELNKPVFSASEYDFSVSFAFQMNSDNSWSPLFETSPMVTGNTRSQDQITAYHPNGAIYIREIEDLRIESLLTFYEDAVPMIMDVSESIDIDTEADFKLAEWVLKVYGVV